MDDDEMAARYTMDSEDEFPPKDSDVMMDYLISTGVDRETAQNHLKAMRPHRSPTTFMEVYGRGAIVDCANRARRDLNVQVHDGLGR